MNASIIEYLRANGERMDAEIAKAFQISVAQVHGHLAQLSSSGDVICCKVTRYLGGKIIEGTSYRMSGTRSGKPMQPAGTEKAR